MTNERLPYAGPIGMILPGALVRTGAGLARSVMNRSSAFTRRGISNYILVDAWQPNLEEQVALIKANGLLPESTDVLSMHRDFANEPEQKSGFEFESMQFADYIEGLRKEVDPARPEIERYYAGGKYVLFVAREQAGRKIGFADHLREGSRYKRSYFNGQGREVRAIRYDEDNRPSVDEYFTVSGRRYLISHEPLSTRGSYTFLKPDLTTVKFETPGHLAHYWLTTYHSELVTDAVLISEYATRLHGLQQLRITNNCRVVYTLHSSHLGGSHRFGDPVKPELKETLESIANMDALVVLTPQQRLDIIKEYGNGNIRSIPHSVSMRAIERGEGMRERGLIVMLGRLSPEKQITSVVQQFAKLAKEFPQAVLEIWGIGPEESKIAKMIEETAMVGRVKLMGFTAEPLIQYSRAEVAIFASSYEGQSLSLLEALAQGCVPISYDFKYGPRMMIQDCVNGMIVDQNDAADLLTTAFTLLRDPDYLAQLSSNSKKSSDVFSEDAMVDAWLEVIDDLRNAKV